MMWYFTSDTHFDHPWVCRWRGFSYVTEMDKYLIDSWNKTVHGRDVVVVLGDIFWTNHLNYNMNVWNKLKGRRSN